MSLCIYTIRDRCRYNIAVTASYRYIRNKPCRDLLVFVVPLCFIDILVDLLGLTGDRILYLWSAILFGFILDSCGELFNSSWLSSLELFVWLIWLWPFLLWLLEWSSWTMAWLLLKLTAWILLSDEFVLLIAPIISSGTCTDWYSFVTNIWSMDSLYIRCPLPISFGLINSA